MAHTLTFVRFYFGRASYCASKFGVVGYSCVQRRELAPYGIRVVCVEPGFAKTPLLDVPLKAADTTQTRLLEKTFVDNDPAALFERMGGSAMQSADDVADGIMLALFSSQFVPPHFVIDKNTPKFLFYQVISFLPHDWADVLIHNAQTKRLEAKKAT